MTDTPLPDDIERRLAPTLRAKADQLVVDDAPFDPAGPAPFAPPPLAPRRRASRRVLVASTALALAAVLLVVVMAGRIDSNGSRASTGSVPRSTPAVPLAPLTGGPTTSLGVQLDRTPVVVNFFSSWCTPCIREMPALQRVHQDLGAKVAILGVAVSDSPQNALAAVAKAEVTYPTYADVGDALRYFGVARIPTTVFLDRAGKVLDVHTGAMSETELRAELAHLYGIRAIS